MHMILAIQEADTAGMLAIYKSIIFCTLLQGQAVDIRIHAEEMRRMASRLYEIYSKHTGQPTDVIGES